MASSFRDPDGFVMVANGRVLRFLNRAGQQNLQEVFAAAFARQAVAVGQLVASWPVDLNSVSPCLSSRHDCRTVVGRAMKFMRSSNMS